MDCGVTPSQSASLHLLAKLLDLTLLALDQVQQALAVGGAERLGGARLRRGRGRRPSCPWALTSTGCAVPSIVLPLIPAMKVRFWSPLVPIRIAFDSPALPALAMSMLSEPVVRF